MDVRMIGARVWKLARNATGKTPYSPLKICDRSEAFAQASRREIDRRIPVSKRLPSRSSLAKRDADKHL